MSLQEIRAEFDVVVILVGTNPIPCVVSALALAEPGDQRICLCFTDNPVVSGRSENVRDFLVKAGYRADHLLRCEIDHADPDLIAMKLVDCIGDMNPRGVNVCYTAGTKAMSVHAVRAVSTEFSALPLAFSYIDAHRDVLQVTFGGTHERSGTTRVVSLAPGSPDLTEEEVNRLDIRLSDVLHLHDWTINASWNGPLFPRSAKALLQLHAAVDGRSPDNWVDAWKDWSKPLTDRRVRNFGAVECVMPTADCLRGFADAWSEEIAARGVTPERFTMDELAGQMPKPAANRRLTRKDLLEYLRNWLDGSWLESAMMDVLVQLKDEKDLNGALMGVETRDPRFEVDCLALNGYRLSLFSCTAGNARDQGKYKEAKLKLFEAIARGRQLGGDEARIALVCAARPDIGEKIEKELNLDFGAGRLARVFHTGHMANLKDEVKDWLTVG
jgi:hypothetical protein